MVKFITWVQNERICGRADINHFQNYNKVSCYIYGLPNHKGCSFFNTVTMTVFKLFCQNTHWFLHYEA